MSAPISTPAPIEFDAIPTILNEVEAELTRRIEGAEETENGIRCFERLSEDYLKVVCNDGVHLWVFDASDSDEVRIFVDTEVCGTIVRYGGAEQVIKAMAFRKLKDTLEVNDAGGIEAWREAGYEARFHRVDAW